MRRHELIIFDWDGTLMDSTAKIARCFQMAAHDSGIAVPTDQRARQIIGLGLREAVVALFPDADAATHARVVDNYRKHFFSPDDEADVLFDGVDDGLRRLSKAGYLLAIATGKSRRGLNHVLRDKAIAGYFCVTRCADEARSKPHPQMLHDILDHTGIDAKQAVMVGDTSYDLEMARAIEMPSIGVTYGAHALESLTEHAPVAIFDSFNDVCRWFVPPQWVCAADALADGGDGVRFTVEQEGRTVPAFAIRYHGRVHAYVNRCAHKEVELDWVPGRFFDAEQRYLICATHGATYAPESGRCVAGPCSGGLAKLEVIEKNNAVYLATNDGAS